VNTGVLVFVLAITFSIALHELGHLATAKFFGMKATRYFIGFGPTLWSTRRGETEYGIKALPLGGFVKIVGMTPLEEVEPGDERRAFYRQDPSQRAIVLASGSAMHFVLAFVLLMTAFVVTGVKTGEKLSTRVEAVSACVSDTAACPPDAAPSPARKAGIQAGDRIVSFDGRPVDDWVEDLSARAREHPGGPAPVVVERDGRELRLTVDVVRVERELEGGEKRVVGFLGLVPEPAAERYGFFRGVGESVQLGATLIKATGKAIIDLPGQIPELVRQTFGDEVRTGEGPASLVGAGRVAGQASDAGEVDSLILLVAAINIFIGLFNLLPLLPLDGGHLAVLWFEEFRSALARRLRRPAPGRVDLNKLMPATYAFLALLVTLQVLVLYADIANPIPDPFSRG
jgi:membrane-associated protease RseP (regulator of RpoE activity)